MDTNAGDYFPSFLRMNGFDHLVLYGRAADWTLLLLREGRVQPTGHELLRGFCAELTTGGFPLMRALLAKPTLHPQIFATVLVWRADTPGIRTVHEQHDILHQPKFADSPFAPIIRGGAGGVRRRIEEEGCPLDFPVVLARVRTQLSLKRVNEEVRRLAELRFVFPAGQVLRSIMIPDFLLE